MHGYIYNWILWFSKLLNLEYANVFPHFQALDMHMFYENVQYQIH